MKKLYILYILILSVLLAQDFNTGPYGTEYFDTAGPFYLIDLNNDNKVLGDLNIDSKININDIIIVIGSILESIDLGDNIYIADLNEDNQIDILDITLIIERILYPSSFIPENCWDFETEWDNQDNYVFIHLDPTNNNSTEMWSNQCPANICSNGSDHLTLIEKSDLNTHYFFISSGTNPEQDIIEIQQNFNTLIEQNLDIDLQEHWKEHLHFIPTRSSELNNWIKNRINGTYAF